MSSVTRRRSRTERPAASAPTRLIEATERLLAAGTPYIELSVEQLCSEAGVARSTFYVHFRDKGELVMRVAERMLAQLSEAAEAWWAPRSDREELLAATRRLVDVYATHRAVMVALSETAVYDPELRAVQEAMVDRQARAARRADRGRQARRQLSATCTRTRPSWRSSGWSGSPANGSPAVMRRRSTGSPRRSLRSHGTPSTRTPRGRRVSGAATHRRPRAATGVPGAVAVCERRPRRAAARRTADPSAARRDPAQLPQHVALPPRPAQPTCSSATSGTARSSACASSSATTW